MWTRPTSPMRRAVLTGLAVVTLATTAPLRADPPVAESPAAGASAVESPAADASAAESPGAIPARPDPAAVRWAESSGNGCHRYRGRRVCDGPRRVPVLDGEALARAESLGLVGALVAHRATSGAVPAGWVEAARTSGAAVREDLLWPVPAGRLWRGYGPRRGFRRTRRGRLIRTRRRHMHQGLDIGATPGADIVAVNDGLVVYSDNGMHGYGNAVLIVHADGAVTLYAHCTETYVVAGQAVRRGQVIAAVGATGIAHGAHLHFEYRRGGVLQNPAPLLTSPSGVATAPEVVEPPVEDTEHDDEP